MSDPDGLLEVMRQRRSVRRFTGQAVPAQLLEELVEAASWAPSAGARQDWLFNVILSPEVKARMAEVVRARWEALLARETGSALEALREYAGNFTWFDSAPVVAAISAARPEAFLEHLLGNAAESVAGRGASAAMAAQNLMLAAWARGLGSCCLTGPLVAQEELGEVLGLGRRRQLVCLIALGYPAEHPTAPARRPVEQIMRLIA